MTLYIVATPIGHLGDITARAIEVLSSVDWIAAEDTRHSQRLLSHLGLKKPLISLHDHNERDKANFLLQKITMGGTIALISDAGTPLISDPGYHLVRLAQDQGIKVVPIPGACALIAALSISGLPTDRFVFEGFLPAKSTNRQKQLKELLQEPRTLIFYEAPHRLLDCLQDLVHIFGPTREVVLARELTKTFETLKRGTLEELLNWVQLDTQQQKGEIVLLVAGFPDPDKETLTSEADSLLKILLSELSVKQASSLAAKILGIRKNSLYEQALLLKNNPVIPAKAEI